MPRAAPRTATPGRSSVKGPRIRANASLVGAAPAHRLHDRAQQRGDAPGELKFLAESL
jgi:hypothetical protein